METAAGGGEKYNSSKEKEKRTEERKEQEEQEILSKRDFDLQCFIFCLSVGLFLFPQIGRELIYPSN